MSWWTVNGGNVVAFLALVGFFTGALFLQARHH